MKRIVWCLVIVVLLVISSHAQDPNEPLKPIEVPAPGVEILNKLDSKTVRITISYDVDRKTLIAEKARLLEQLAKIQAQIELQIAAIDARLAVFK